MAVRGRNCEEATAGPVGAGTCFRHVMKVMGRQTDLDLEMVDHEPERRYVLNGIYGLLLFTTEVRFERIAQARASLR
jgi:hypothetical protein